MGISGPLYAIQAGSCAAMASVSAKLAVSSELSEEIVDISHIYIQKYLLPNLLGKNELMVIVRFGGVAGIFLFNALMWVLFTKSMHVCSSTLEATAFNTASNFFFTAVLGSLLLKEHLSFQWCLGSVLMMCGLILLHQGSNISQEKDN